MTREFEDPNYDTALGLTYEPEGDGDGLRDLPEQRQYQARRNSRYAAGLAIATLVAGNLIGYFVGHSIGKDKGKIQENTRCVQVLRAQRDSFLDAAQDGSYSAERREQLRDIASDLNNAARSISIYGEPNAKD